MSGPENFDDLRATISRTMSAEVSGGTIHLVLRDKMQELSRWQMVTTDKLVRDALIGLGWTPPSAAPTDLPGEKGEPG